MNCNVFELIKNNTIVKIKTSKKLFNIIKKEEILYEIKFLIDDKFAEDVIKLADPNLVELHVEMRKWLKENHPEVFI